MVVDIGGSLHLVLIHLVVILFGRQALSWRLGVFAPGAQPGVDFQTCDSSLVQEQG